MDGNLRIRITIKQILKMNPGNPPDKSSFKTPERNPGQAASSSNLRKTPVTALESNKQPTDSPADTARFREINVRISSKSNRPYLEPPPYRSYGSPREYLQYGPEELLRIIEMYEYQIAILKDYIHHSDLLERQRIVQIFGFDYPCTAVVAHEQSKLVLKQLSIKIKHLIKQNSDLKNSRPAQGTRQEFQKEYQENNLLIKENQKLRMIIDQLKNSESQDLGGLAAEVDRLKRDNAALTDNLRKYKSRVDMLEDNARRVDSQLRQTVVPQIPQIRQSSQPQPQPQNNQELQYSKKQLTKQMFEFSQQLEEKNKGNENRIEQLQKRVQGLEARLKDYERERSLRIDSVMKKSFRLTDSVMKLKGDIEVGKEIVTDEETIPRKEEGKIRTTKNFIHKKEEQKQPNVPQPQPQPRTDDPNLVRQLKLAQQSLLMEQMKNKNIAEQNATLKKRIKDLEKELMEKIERNIKLEGIIMGLEKDRDQARDQVRDQGRRNVHNPEVEKELRDIIETLKSCNVANFQLFFREFNEILAQRKLLKQTIESYQTASQALKARKQGSAQQKNVQSSLQQKVNELIEENKRLLAKVSSLEAEVQQYHEQIINSQIQKLNSIKFSEPLMPNGQQAIEWQLIVKKSIEGALVRLYNLERKINQPDKSRGYQSVGQEGSAERGSASNLVRSLGPKPA